MSRKEKKNEDRFDRTWDVASALLSFAKKIQNQGAFEDITFDEDQVEESWPDGAHFSPNCSEKAGILHHCFMRESNDEKARRAFEKMSEKTQWALCVSTMTFLISTEKGE